MTSYLIPHDKLHSAVKLGCNDTLRVRQQAADEKCLLILTDLGKTALKRCQLPPVSSGDSFRDVFDFPRHQYDVIGLRYDVRIAILD
jgi:hypothetical protein